MTRLGMESTVFVVDGDPGPRDSVVSMVRIMGIKSVAFETGEEFLSEGHHMEPGCVVADLRMRGMSGIAMLKSMRQDGSGMPLLLVTAYANVPLAVEALERGAMTILEKPYQSQTLWDQIVRALQLDQELRAIATLRTNLLDRLGSLTEQEFEILKMTVDNVPIRVIATRTELSVRTVNHRRAEILTKLNVDNVNSLILQLGGIGWPTVSICPTR